MLVMIVPAGSRPKTLSLVSSIHPHRVKSGAGLDTGWWQSAFLTATLRPFIAPYGVLIYRHVLPCCPDIEILAANIHDCKNRESYYVLLMFDIRYKNVQYFGVWAEDAGHSMARKKALGIIKGAVDRSYEEDVRSPEVFQALEYLQKDAVRPTAYINFRKGMAIENPEERLQALTMAYQAML